MNKISFSSRGTRLKETKSRSRLESQIRHLVNVCADSVPDADADAYVDEQMSR